MVIALCSHPEDSFNNQEEEEEEDEEEEEEGHPTSPQGGAGAAQIRRVSAPLSSVKRQKPSLIPPGPRPLTVAAPEQISGQSELRSREGRLRCLEPFNPTLGLTADLLQPSAAGPLNPLREAGLSERPSLVSSVTAQLPITGSQP